MIKLSIWLFVYILCMFNGLLVFLVGSLLSLLGYTLHYVSSPCVCMWKIEFHLIFSAIQCYCHCYCWSPLPGLSISSPITGTCEISAAVRRRVGKYVKGRQEIMRKTCICILQAFRQNKILMNNMGRARRALQELKT